MTDARCLSDPRKRAAVTISTDLASERKTLGNRRGPEARHRIPRQSARAQDAPRGHFSGARGQKQLVSR